MSLDTRSEPEIMINTGEILLRRRNGSDGYVAVLYKNLSDTRKPVAKASIPEQESQEEYTDSHHKGELAIPDDLEVIEFDRTNFLELLDQL